MDTYTAEKYGKLVIIGAPRSGTNMLRDALCNFDGVATWPCDEINPIWRHGNVNYPNDQIPPVNIQQNVCAYIRRQFDNIAKRYAAKFVVEKTCANSLRVDFVDAIIPDAKFIFIVRDGLDAVGSAKLRWQSSLDISYTLRKVRFVPPMDLPIYFWRFLKARVHRMVSSEKRLGFWGPAFPGLEDALKKLSLEAVCALQWKACVDRSDAYLSSMPEERVCRVKYEEFVRNPVGELRRIAEFSGINYDATKLKVAVADVSSDSVGKGRRKLSRQILEEI